MLLTPTLVEMLTLDLNKSNANVTVHGKLILNISTNVNVPIRNGTNTLVPGSHGSPLNASSTSLARPPGTATPSAEQTPAAPSASAASTASPSANAQSDDRGDLPVG